MKLSEGSLKKVNDAKNELQDETLDIMNSASVLLKFPQGSGSGVVIHLNSKKVFTVLTALHNLTMHDKADLSEEKNNQKHMVGGKVHYLSTTTVVTHAQGLSRGATINKYEKNSEAKIVSITRNLGLGNVDLCLLCCEIEDGMGLPHCVAGPYDVAADDKTDYRAQTHIDAFDRIKNSPYQYCDPEDKNKYTFYQVGYGRGPGDGDLFNASLDKRQFKLSYPKCLSTLEGIDCKPDIKAIILLDSDANNTTLKGDSGGPLFCVEQCYKNGKIWKEQIYVIGVTRGADDIPIDSKQEDDTNKPDGWLNNSVTSALKYWESQLN
ncbi:hypothetical protein [Vibrio coralliilyticus]|uniref:hypothetical protein n=1 Tax=Vibrio coralliilyticus TaxID=190893 RepID=UPI000306845C|nr:hypothetical protein [Vibrio coralliilyticus]